MEKKLYWRMFEYRNGTRYNSLVVTQEKMLEEVELYFDNYIDDDGFLPPVFEPVMMTEDDFKALPEFEGF